MENYKEEILKSRVGHLGASDANLIALVSKLGSVPVAAKERMAIVKGLKAPIDGVKTQAMALGDEIEMTIFENLHAADPRWQSNFLLESEIYRKPNVSLIAHIDFFLQDDENKVIRIVECKATKADTDTTLETYRNQLYIEYLLGKEYASKLGRAWRIEVQLCHYCTEDFDGVFDEDKITLKRVAFRAAPFNVDKGLDVIDEYLSTLTEENYVPDEQVGVEYLPSQIQEQFNAVATMLQEIKAKELLIEDFKKRLYEFMLSNNIKSLKSETFSITRVDASEQKTFDYKKYLEDYALKYPRKFKKLIADYTKSKKRNGFVQIKLN